MMPEEVRLLDNHYAILFIRGERPVMDLKYDIMKHPDVRMTADGKTEVYVHGEPWDAGPSIELILDPESIKEASGDVQVIDLGDSDYTLLSEEDVEKEIEEQKKKDKQKEEEHDGEERQDD